ncbi:hypothetical protein [Carboxylicivirga taeanensis]|uniref:hypothetical protein n=1 Tax=Carboxylicivirga taeanensis TaxID=1416875 RepID=UPI003F6E0EC8
MTLQGFELKDEKMKHWLFCAFVAESCERNRPVGRCEAALKEFPFFKSNKMAGSSV